MVAWSSVPAEIRHGIIKEMDFRTRFRFRHVSKTDQQIVDSIPLNLPRIVLKFENDHKAKLEFYLGINRKITVDFERSGARVVKVEVSGESIDNPITKLVKFENSALLAIRAFKNIAIHPKTLLEGLEFHHDTNLTSVTRFKIYQLIKKKGIRTKILCITDTTFLYMILPHCSSRDLLEVQSIDNEQDRGVIPLSMVTYTRNLNVAVEGLTLGDAFYIDNMYTPTPGRIPSHVQLHCQAVQLPQFTRTERSPSDVTLKGLLGPNFMHRRITLCGDLACTSQLPFQMQDSGECGMRWTCPKHSDPFEYWYYQQVIQPKPADMNHLPPEQFADMVNVARARVADAFNISNFPYIPMDFPKSYREIVVPNANGVDSVFVVSSVMLKTGNDWEKEMLQKIQAIRKSVKGSEKKEVKVSEAGSASDGSDARDEAEDLKVVGGGAKEGSEGTAEEVQEELKESKGSAKVELKSEVTAGEAKEGLLESEVDGLESKGSEVRKVAGAGEVQEELKVTDALDSDDSDAENPFNTEEFKAKFNGSTDKSWANLMILAVFSVLFAFFFTFFFF